MSEELKPCPFCGEKIEPPKSRQASTDRSEGFVAFAACYCGGYSATAHKMGRGNTEAEAIQEVIALWNRRAQPAEAEGVAVVAWANEALSAFISADCKAYGDSRGGAAGSAAGAHQTPLVRQDDHLAALSAVTAERDRLLAFVTECAGTAGGMVNGNKLSNRAKEVIAAMAAKEA